jgi:cytochrome P450
MWNLFPALANFATAFSGGGGDTTSILMRACIFYVALSPPTYARLQREIDTACDNQGIQQTAIPYQLTKDLPFLQAVIKESARLWPSIVWQLPRDSPQGGIMVNGRYFIPEGYSISLSPMAQNRDPEIYGSDAKEFRPDRWLEEPATAHRMDRLSATFGGNGPRSCLGKNLALVCSLLHYLPCGPVSLTVGRSKFNSCLPVLFGISNSTWSVRISRGRSLLLGLPLRMSFMFD